MIMISSSGKRKERHLVKGGVLREVISLFAVPVFDTSRSSL